MKIDKFSNGTQITHLELEDGDHFLACPFCGSCEVELLNTHTACYWIACPCGVEVTGKGYGGHKQSENLSLSDHKRAKKSALERWNRREAA